MSDRDDELLAAYVDGVGELAPDERRRIEAKLADDPALRDEAEGDRALIGQLRELPDEGAEPDWQAMERAIRAEVGPDVPRRWWAGWRWLAPIGALAVSGAVLVLVLRGGDVQEEHHAEPPVAVRTPPAAPPAAEPPHGTVALWLDGTAVEVDDASADDLLGSDEPDDPGADGLLPADDLAWVDELGEDEVAAAEAWLARKKS